MAEAGEADGDNDGTRLFSALSSTLADVPPDRVAGAIMITDGRVHDVPEEASALGFAAPLHALITGHANEVDRRVVLTKTPRFGIVGQSQTVGFRIEDQGAHIGAAEVIVRRDGEVLEKRVVTVHTDININVPIPHAGPNIVEIEASPLEGELTQVNNRAVLSIDGVRDKLRVLLVSGEPHAGERTWRNLLKSDASVDLVHFTILRPPEKQDGTPINELSLIAFPTRELFQQKISEFQLIIFDRYARQGVLPMIYFDNIAKYVRDGGAVMIAAGPDYASPSSIWHTPLDAILPAEPSGEVTMQPFFARLTQAGQRHPVTRGLQGSDDNPPHWSHWFRLVNSKHASGTSVMEGPDGKPLLVLAREDKGRVAMLLSDHIWLWARGYEGGGPHLDLLRRLSHWLMKQPELEEEALRLIVHGRDVTVQRQTMADTVNEVTLTSPTGARSAVNLKQVEPGLWQADMHRQGARPVARERRQAHRARQCRAGQSARIRRGDIDHAGAGQARRCHRRQRQAAGRRQLDQRAARGAGAHLDHLQGRRLDRPEDARGVRGARHRRAADLRRPDRLAAADRLARGHVGARRPLIPFRSFPRKREPVLNYDAGMLIPDSRFRGDERIIFGFPVRPDHALDAVEGAFGQFRHQEPRRVDRARASSPAPWECA